MPARRVLGILHHDDRAALAEDEPAAGGVEGPCLLRRRPQAVEPRHHEAAEEVGAAREHHVGASGAHPVGSERDRLRPGGARELGRHDRAAAAEPPADTDGRRVVRDPLEPVDRVPVEPALEEQHAAERRAERDRESPRVDRRGVEAGVGQRLGGRLEGEGAGTVGIRARHVADFCHGARLEVVCRESGDGPHGGAAGQEPLPEGLQTATERGDDPAAGDHGGARRTGQPGTSGPRRAGNGAISRGRRRGQSGVLHGRVATPDGCLQRLTCRLDSARAAPPGSCRPPWGSSRARPRAFRRTRSSPRPATCAA